MANATWLLIFGIITGAFGTLYVSQNTQFVVLNFDSLEARPSTSSVYLPFTVSLGSTWTIELWVFLLGDIGSNMLVFSYSQNASNYMALMANCPTSSCELNLQIVQNGVVEANIQNNVNMYAGWVHVVIGYQSGSGYLVTETWTWGYPLNSLTIDSQTNYFSSTINISATSLNFGYGIDVDMTGLTKFSGALDDFRVWSKYFTSNEAVDPIREAATMTGNEPNLVNYYSFENDNKGSHLIQDVVTNSFITVQNYSGDGLTWIFASEASDNYMPFPVLYNAFVTVPYDGGNTITFVLFSSEVPYDFYVSSSVVQFPYGAKVCVGETRAQVGSGCSGLTISNQSFAAHNNEAFYFSFYPSRGACGKTQDVLITPFNNLVNMTFRYTVKPIAPTLSRTNYTLPATGGSITISGTNFGLLGALDGTESISIRFPADQGGPKQCTSASVSNGAITCNIAPGIGKDYPIDINICNGAANALQAFFAYEAPDINNVTLESGNGIALVIITGRNFGPSRTFPFDGTANFINIEFGTNTYACDQSIIGINETHITCSAALPLEDGAYHVSLSIGGQTAQYEAYYNNTVVTATTGTTAELSGSTQSTVGSSGTQTTISQSTAGSTGTTGSGGGTVTTTAFRSATTGDSDVSGSCVVHAEAWLAVLLLVAIQLVVLN